MVEGGGGTRRCSDAPAQMRWARVPAWPLANKSVRKQAARWRKSYGARTAGGIRREAFTRGLKVWGVVLGIPNHFLDCEILELMARLHHTQSQKTYDTYR